MNFQYLAPEDLPDLLSDLSFYAEHPEIALENICSRLNNFIPTSPEHEFLLSEAKRVTDPKNLFLKRGAFLTGQPGIGKTHISIAVAKELLQYGFQLFFVTSHTAERYEYVEMAPVKFGYWTISMTLTIDVCTRYFTGLF